MSVLSNIYVIVTHKISTKTKERAAEAWRHGELCAIGWEKYGRLDRVSKRIIEKDWRFAKARELFLQIRKGDLIIAYPGKNMVAYVGTALDKYSGSRSFNRNNEVGREDGFGYPNQIRVKWCREPNHFDRAKELPLWLARQFPKRGQTIRKIDLGKHSFETAIQVINNSISMSGLTKIEDLVKAGLNKYLYSAIDTLEHGLTINFAESGVGRGRPDFEALDRNETPVLIECKGTGRENDIEQVKKYGKAFGLRKKTPRLMLVAFDFDESCRRAARSDGVQLIECELNFNKLR
jgi:hypothetical protein